MPEKGTYPVITRNHMNQAATLHYASALIQVELNSGLPS